jgi:hypothetical protein
MNADAALELAQDFGLGFRGRGRLYSSIRDTSVRREMPSIRAAYVWFPTHFSSTARASSETAGISARSNPLLAFAAKSRARGRRPIRALAAAGS